MNFPPRCYQTAHGQQRRSYYRLGSSGVKASKKRLFATTNADCWAGAIGNIAAIYDYQQQYLNWAAMRIEAETRPLAAAANPQRTAASPAAPAPSNKRLTSV